MRNIKITIQYDGTRYQGWQKQDNTTNTIQEKLEVLLSKMTNEKIELKGSGRTDRGVHAYGQVANFHTTDKRTVDEIQTYMNTYLPKDIAIVHIEEVAERFHSRLNASEKIYRYRLIVSKVPKVFDYKYAYIIEEMPDIIKMREAAKKLIGTHDFQAFTSAKKGKKSTLRTIYDIQIEEEQGEITLTYRGNGFLYHMVRLLTGTLLEVGLGVKSQADMDKIIEGKKRENAGFLVPGLGLTLMKVIYK